MTDIDSLLKDGNLYSIEYVGFFIFKFSLSNKSILYNSVNELIVEFNNGLNIFKNNLKIENENNVFDLFGLSITNCKIENDILKIYLENNYKLESINSEDNLIDRIWVIKTYNDKTYIINDSNEINYSDDLKKNK
jgi:hypothetical protein